MADLSDVTAYLATVAAAAVYPNGTSSPSVAAMDVRIEEGWPIAAQLDLDMAGEVILAPGDPPSARAGGPVANVSVYPLQGTNIIPYQVQNNYFVIKQPVLGMSIGVVGDAITVTGQPNAGEFLTIEADRQFIYSAGGANQAAILATLLAAIQVNYPLATVVGSVLTIPYNFQLNVRIGGVGTLGYVTHRQRQSILITAWAPDHVTRNTLIAAIDNLLKQKLTVTMPDTSQALITYNRTNLSDEQQAQIIYRRDLVYDVEYATVWQFPGTIVTSVSINQAGGNWGVPGGPPPPSNPPTITRIY
jgi:hypothetical protein